MLNNPPHSEDRQGKKCCLTRFASSVAGNRRNQHRQASLSHGVGNRRAEILVSEPTGTVIPTGSTHGGDTAPCSNRTRQNLVTGDVCRHCLEFAIGSKRLATVENDVSFRRF